MFGIFHARAQRHVRERRGELLGDDAGDGRDVGEWRGEDHDLLGREGQVGLGHVERHEAQLADGGALVERDVIGGLVERVVEDVRHILQLLRDLLLVRRVRAVLHHVALEERLLHALVRVGDLVGGGEVTVPERERPHVLREVVDEVAHHEVDLLRGVVLVEHAHRFLGLRLLVELLEDEVLVDFVDVDVEVVDGVVLEIDDELREPLATELLRVGVELLGGIELRRPQPPRGGGRRDHDRGHLGGVHGSVGRDHDHGGPGTRPRFRLLLGLRRASHHHQGQKDDETGHRDPEVTRGLTRICVGWPRRVIHP